MVPLHLVRACFTNLHKAQHYEASNLYTGYNGDNSNRTKCYEVTFIFMNVQVIHFVVKTEDSELDLI